MLSFRKICCRTPAVLAIEVEIEFIFVARQRHDPADAAVDADPFQRLQIGKIANIISGVGLPGFFAWEPRNIPNAAPCAPGNGCGLPCER